MEDVANKIVNYLCENITDASGKSANALVRFYNPPYNKLDQGLKGSPRASWAQLQAPTPTA